jgi:type IV secretion system protein VirD4
MSSLPQERKPSLAQRIAMTGVFAYGATHIPAYPPELYCLRLLCGAVAGYGGVLVALSLPGLLCRLYRRRKALKPTDSHGTAKWATPEDHKKYGHYDKRGVFLGLCAKSKKPLFFAGETHGLTLSPAGGGKTVNFVIPALLHLRDLSMIVPDLKGTLACVTKAAREKRFGHKVFCVNPGRLYEDILGKPARYNPLQILIDDWTENRHADLLSDARAMALQLSPEPPKGGENAYFRDGSRSILVFVFVYLVTREGDIVAVLSLALRILRDDHKMLEALHIAACSDILSGDLADIARDLLPKIEAEDKRQWESFRTGAVQALDAFSSSGHLAESTAACDFRFSDLKDEKATVYLIADPGKMKVYAPWLGLLGWCAVQEMIRKRSHKQVLFLFDEAANFRIEGLSSYLTTLREYGCRVWFVLQELEQYVDTYSRSALEVLLGQCECKQIFAVQSHKTAELLSQMLGSYTVKTASYDLGHGLADDVRRSAGETARRLLNPDEVRQFSDSILIIKDRPPVHALKVGYNEVSPWNKWASVNPLHGGKPFKGKIRLKIRY